MPKPSSRRGAAASALLLLGGCADPRVPPPQPGWDMTVLRAAHAVDWHFVEVRMEGGTARERAEAELSPEAFPKADLPPGLSRDGSCLTARGAERLRDAETTSPEGGETRGPGGHRERSP